MAPDLIEFSIRDRRYPRRNLTMSTLTIPKAPDWLAKRDGALSPGIRDHMAYVLIGGAPQYKIEVRPAVGKFICSVEQSVNGKRLDDGSTYGTPETALTGGLDQLRAKLGW